MRDGRRVGAAVAGGGGDEDPGRGGVVEGEVDRVDDEVRGAGDGVVDDVDPVADRVVDGVEQVGGAAGALAVGLPPQRLVDGDAGGGRHAGDVADGLAVDGGRDVVQAGGGGGGVGAVAVVVAGRAELGLPAAEPAAVVVPRPDDLVVAGDLLLGGAGALVALVGAAGGPLLVDDGLVGAGFGQRGEAGALGPEAGVDDADDDALAGVGRVAELLGPGAAVAGQAQEVGRGDGVEGAPFVLPDAAHARGPLDAGLLRRGQGGREAVEGRLVHGDGLADAGPPHDRRPIGADPSAGGLLPAGRITRQLDDVEGGVRLRPGRDRHREDG